MTAREILDYAEQHGNDAALVLLMSIGRCGFDGTEVELDELKKILESGC